MRTDKQKANLGRTPVAGFNKNPQNINTTGQNKKIYTILKEKGYTPLDIKTAYGEMAWYTMAELQAVHKDETKPVITRIVANQFYLALKNGDYNKVKEILEHTIGKPKQDISFEQVESKIVIRDISGQEIDATEDNSI